ncbi:acyl-CoA thioesterase [Actinomadura luteofluorescens]|uniref:acyl-CoA thioesterase n=1 Tax=Actinomadura luteofluorescens TaxID=46163 RepID=UPI0021643C8D|nr:acyl-CoA thioesterase [Actinomadura glauciflava]MCR3742846.1 enediyne biosynthesis thioesterase [Actinomadura glauciflava]
MKAYFEYRHRVTFADTNLVGNVYFTNYLSWQGTCRELFLAEKAPKTVARLNGDLALVTSSCSCEFFSELYALDTVSVRMSLVGMDFSQITMGFEYYRLTDGPAQLVARGEQTVSCTLRAEDGLTTVEVPGELRTALDAYAPDPRGAGRPRPETSPR